MTLILTLPHNGPDTPIFISLKYLWQSKYCTFVIFNFQTIGAKIVEFKMIFVSRNPTIKLNIVRLCFWKFYFNSFSFSCEDLSFTKTPPIIVLVSWKVLYEDGWTLKVNVYLFGLFVCMWPCHNLLEALVENLFLKPKCFQLNVICNYVAIVKKLFENWIMTITNEINS